MPARYWRMRMTVGGVRDVSAEAWDRGQVGVWYGAWSAQELEQALEVDPADPARILRGLPHQLRLEWGQLDLSTVLRFQAIGPDDWVIVFLRDRAEFGLAQLEAGMRSEDGNPSNHAYPELEAQEVFKYRRIRNSKTFSIPDLPDAYHLLASQGRANVHEFHGMRPHVRLLAESEDVAAVRASMAAMPLDVFLDFLGAVAWESFCTGYLTLEHGFVPTGLATGRTLPTFDIVGRRVSDGMHIFAQCKKDPGPMEVEASFRVALGAHTGPCLAFYFAYGGCHGGIPGIEVFGKDRMLAWLATERGEKYRTLLLGG
jgi:hypothetical protein